MKQVVVMAAGMGTRMGEITKHVPKGLIPINGKPILERNIEFMIEAGIDRVVLILGYMSDKFEYLIDKYADKIEIVKVYNKDYDKYNNLISMYYASKYFDKDSFIVCADLYLVHNIYKKYVSEHNFYLHKYVQNLSKPEWVAKLSEDNCIISVDTKGRTGSIYTGVSYWPAKDMQYIRQLIMSYDWNEEKTKNMYWDEIFFPVFNTFPVHVLHYDDQDIFEIDDQEDLNILRQFAEYKT